MAEDGDDMVPASMETGEVPGALQNAEEEKESSWTPGGGEEEGVRVHAEDGVETWGEAGRTDSAGGHLAPASGEDLEQVSGGGDESGEPAAPSPVVDDGEEDSFKLGKRTSRDPSMDLPPMITKRVKNGRVNGALLCLPLRKPKKFEKLPPLVAAKELARCMHEPKFHLLRNVIMHVGIEKAVQLFNETAQIQEAGGVVSCEGKVKAPGGVFFSLLKKTASKDQLEEIFRVEKKLHSYKKRSNRARRLREKRVESCEESGENGTLSKTMDTTTMNVFTRLSVALSQGQRVEANMCSVTTNVSSDMGVAHTQNGGQSTEAEADQTRRANVFSRLGMRKLDEGQSPTQQCANEGAGSKEGEESMDVDSVNPKGTSVQESDGEGNGCGLRSIEDIWEREKAAALEFDDASDSGVEFAIHLSAL